MYACMCLFFVCLFVCAVGKGREGVSCFCMCVEVFFPLLLRWVYWALLLFPALLFALLPSLPPLSLSFPSLSPILPAAGVVD